MFQQVMPENRLHFGYTIRLQQKDINMQQDATLCY